LYPDPFFEENLNLKREIWNFHRSSQYSWIGDGYRGEGRVTCSDRDGLTCIQTHYLKRLWIWRGKFEISTIAPNIAESVMGTGVRVGWPALIGMVWLVSRPIIWRDFESEEGIIIAGLQPLIQPKQSRVPRRGSGDLLQMGWFIYHLDLFDEENPDMKRESLYQACSPCYGCFNVLTLNLGLTGVA
jgi:hypothetical protein